MVLVDHNAARTLKSCETREQTKGYAASAYYPIIECGSHGIGVRGENTLSDGGWCFGWPRLVKEK